MTERVKSHRRRKENSGSKPMTRIENGPGQWWNCNFSEFYGLLEKWLFFDQKKKMALRFQLKRVRVLENEELNMNMGISCDGAQRESNSTRFIEVNQQMKLWFFFVLCIHCLQLIWFSAKILQAKQLGFWLNFWKWLLLLLFISKGFILLVDSYIPIKFFTPFLLFGCWQNWKEMILTCTMHIFSLLAFL